MVVYTDSYLIRRVLVTEVNFRGSHTQQCALRTEVNFEVHTDSNMIRHALKTEVNFRGLH